MRLADLHSYNPITIQCHDNPDADAIASGYGLYTYFREQGKEVRLVYAGGNRIQKTNLTLMVERLQIPITWLEDAETPLTGLLLTVDCQYGAGNVTRIKADQIALIDHHQIEVRDVALSEIRSNLGSCSTLVWKMMSEEGFSWQGKLALGTALYYGLYSDTNQFSEISHPVDKDMRDTLPYEKSLLHLFRNSNLSLEEMQITGNALIQHIYQEKHRYAMIKASPCDPNILGLISDFLIQVDSVDTCVVYQETEAGLKYSVRSCIKEVKANELAVFLAGAMGSGGGHREKAGGFVSKLSYEEEYAATLSEDFFGQRLEEYFNSSRILDAETCRIDLTGMRLYERKKIPQGYVTAKEVLPVGTQITIRTMEGDGDLRVEEDMILLIGVKGEVYPTKRSSFEKDFKISEEKYSDLLRQESTEYVPTIRNRRDGSVKEISQYAGVCIPAGEMPIRAKELTEIVKVFPIWDKEKYMLGKPGDFLAVRCDDLQDIFVVERDIFLKTYSLLFL